MRLLAMILASALTVTSAPVQSQSATSSLLMPSPISIILTVGRWLTEGRGEDRVYYIRVQARGATESEARREAYKRAIEEAIGSLVLTELVVIDDALRRREIIEYSSAYVDRFKVLNQVYDGRHFVVDMDIWIRRSTIADRLLVESQNSQEVDGSRIQVQVETLNHERSQGVRVLSAVLADYPARAYDIRNQSVDVRYANKRAQINIEFDLSFNASYLYSLWETLKTVGQSANAGYCRTACREPYIVHMIGRHDRILFNRWEWTFGFTEPEPMDAIWRDFIASRPAVLMTVRDGAGHALQSSCHRWTQLDGSVTHTYPPWQFVQFTKDNTQVSIDGRQTLRARIETREIGNLAQVRSIDLKVVRSSSCPN